MYLNESRSRSLADTFALLAGSGPTHEMLAQLAQPLAGLMEADYLVSRDWDAQTGRFNICVAHNMDPASVKAYHDYYQFCDPVTPRLRAHRQATLVSTVIPPDELVRTEFYNDFLCRDGMYWGLNLYAYEGEDCVGDLVIFRSRQRENFNKDDLALLGLVEPAFTSALVRLKPTQAPAVDWAPTDDAAVLRVLAARAHLSPREAEVVLLASRGTTDKEIARELGIGFTTVRYHLANSFRKLGVEGRNKLAHRVSALI